jgi:hypothetical protein
VTGRHAKPAVSRKPVKKVTAAGAAGAAVVIAVWVASFFGVHVPAEVASSATVLVSFGAGYLKKP